jgi:hypothetical protein
LGEQFAANLAQMHRLIRALRLYPPGPFCLPSRVHGNSIYPCGT